MMMRAGDVSARDAPRDVTPRDATRDAMRRARAAATMARRARARTRPSARGVMVTAATPRASELVAPTRHRARAFTRYW